MSKPTQKTIAFEEPALTYVEAIEYEPTDAALAAFERLEDWLIDPQTGKTTERDAKVLGRGK